MKWPTVPEPNWTNGWSITKVGSLQMSTCGAGSRDPNRIGLDGLRAGFACFSARQKNDHMGPESGLHNEQTTAAT